MTTRISTQQIFNTSQSHVAEARNREISSSEKAASQKEINRPSDNPTGWVRAQSIKDDLSQRNTIAKNAGLASHMLTVSENVLTQVIENVQRAHELAISASSTTGNEGGGRNQTREHLLAEVKTLFDSTLRTLNTRYAGKTVLGGYQTDRAAFDETGKYVGDSGSFQIEVGKGLVIPVNLSAQQVIQGKGITAGVDVPEVLGRLVDGLEHNDTEMIRSTLGDLVRAGDQLSLGRSEVGARMSEIEHAVNSHEEQKIDDTDDIAKIEEVDAIKAFTDLTRDQTVLRAAIGTTQKILSEDPVNNFFKT